MKILYVLLALVLAAGTAEWHGHSRGYDAGVAATQADATRQVDAARAAKALAEAQRDAAEQNLDNVRRTLNAQKTRLQLANTFADAAMAEAATLRKQLSAATAARTTALREAAHDSPECADLARLPVCPAVAERLWPARAASASAGASH